MMNHINSEHQSFVSGSINNQNGGTEFHFIQNALMQNNHLYISNDRTDYDTPIPVLRTHKDIFGSVLEEVTADSGCCRKYKQIPWICSWVIKELEGRTDLIAA